MNSEDYEEALIFVNQAIELDDSPELQTLRAGIEKPSPKRSCLAKPSLGQKRPSVPATWTPPKMRSRPHLHIGLTIARSTPCEGQLNATRGTRASAKGEGLLDEARRQMAARKFTAALDVLREAQKLDPSAPSTAHAPRETFKLEHQREKQRRRARTTNREVQDAIDRDDYKTASAKAAEALRSFPMKLTLQD